MNEQAMRNAMPWLTRLTAEDRQEVDDVLDAAVEWQAGRLPLIEAARVGQIVSPGTDAPSAFYSRLVARFLSLGGDSRGPTMQALLEALVRFQGAQVTNFGIFDADELAASGVVIRGRP